MIDLDWKIKFSFDKAIEYAYSEPVQNNFSIFRVETEEERNAYYYIENAIFRITTLWDILANIYNIYYEINIKSRDIYLRSCYALTKDIIMNIKYMK